MNRDVCEHFNPVDLPCDKCKPASVQKSTLREAAQQALKAMEKATRFMSDKDYRKLNESIDVLKAALAEPVQEPDLSRCPKCGGPADNGHDRSIPPNPYFCTKCMEEPHTGVTLKPVLYADRRLTNEEIDAVVGRPKVEPVECPNCASLEAQNTELDRKLADLEQTSLELCKACGWRTVIPGEGCLNCARSKLAELERKPLTEEEIKRIDDSTHFHESPDWSLRFARAIERAHGIGEKE